VTPAAGGYTIYSYSATQTGNLSYFSAANDAALIAETNRIAGASYTTAAQCLDYFAGQTDRMVFNIDYPPVITNGLVLNLDAGFTPSYPTTGTTWYDVSSGGNNGTLINGPTFSSTNGGSVVFDGADDYVSTTNPISNNNTHTISFWFYNDITKNLNVIISMSVGSGYSFIEVDPTVTYVGYSTSGPQYRSYPYNLTTNSWNHFTVVKNGSGDNMDLYVNGIKLTNYSGIVDNLGSSSTMYIGKFQSDGWQTKGKISSTLIYNRSLTQSEVLQNFNATKSRFGL
jgi:hypothetical protein